MFFKFILLIIWQFNWGYKQLVLFYTGCFNKPLCMQTKVHCHKSLPPSLLPLFLEIEFHGKLFYVVNELFCLNSWSGRFVCKAYVCNVLSLPLGVPYIYSQCAIVHAWNALKVTHRRQVDLCRPVLYNIWTLYFKLLISNFVSPNEVSPVAPKCYSRGIVSPKWYSTFTFKLEISSLKCWRNSTIYCSSKFSSKYSQFALN